MLGWLFFLASAALLAGSSLVVARRRGAHAGDRFFLGLLVAATHLALASVLCSPFHAYTPVGILATQAAIVGVAIPIARRIRTIEPASDPATPWRPLDLALALGIAVALFVSLAAQLCVPIAGWDERMYNASRPAYWLQYRSVLPYVTHNDRQVTFPFGAELWLGWPMMMTRTEWPARLASWLAHPACALGVFWLARAIGSARRAALAASLLVATTPTIMLNAGFGQKQDLWNAAYVLAAAYWAVRAGAASCRIGPATRPAETRDGPRHTLLAAVSIAFAVNVKITSLACVPVLGMLVVLAGTWREARRRALAAAIGLLAGVLLSGLVVTLASNVRAYGHPLGNPRLSALGKPDLSLQQAWTHAVRAPLFLVEFPEIPIESARRSLERAGRSVLATLRADAPLRLEGDPVWPGRFEFTVAGTAWRYSLGGMLMLPALAWAVGRGLREVRRTWPRVTLSGPVWAGATALPLFLGLVFLVRWMGGAAERYWIGAYAVSAAVGVEMLARATRGRPSARALTVAALVWAAYPPLITYARRIDWATTKERLAAVDEPFAAAVGAMPAGARILAVLSQSARDYPLFRPRDGYPNYVASWGKEKPDRDRLRRLIERHRITHVLFGHPQVIGLHWDGGLSIIPLVEFVRALPGARQVPLQGTDQLLFELPGS